MTKKKIAILGSTGSIGCSSLEVIRHLGQEEYSVVALAAHSNIDLLEAQAKEFNPKLIAVYDVKKAAELQRRLPAVQVVAGIEGVNAVAAFDDADLVISALVGTLGLIPTVAAIKAKKNIALANKEVLVSGGALVISLAKEYGVEILPVDSEHSAIFQCLNGERREEVQRLILTASGGPFRDFSSEQLEKITVADALNHPTWKMGPKVTIDSSTLMNKGLEVIEAHWLFGIAPENIDVVIHPQSVIHSMVEYRDGSVIAQMSKPTMHLPIQYALTYPERSKGMIGAFDFKKYATLEFFTPDVERFRCLKLAFDSIVEGQSMPCFMNAANEVLVERFLKGKISWRMISQKLDMLMSKHNKISIHAIEDVVHVDHEARVLAVDV